jgi:hypothetical protein
MTTSDKLDEPSVLRGTQIAGASASWGARDAHGLVLTVLAGRGPVRVAENLDRLMDVAWAYDQRGRWLVGGVVP